MNENKNEVEEEFSIKANIYFQNNFNSGSVCGSLNNEITVLEIRQAVSQMQSGKSPGPDGLQVDIIKSLLGIISPLLHTLFNSIFNKGSFPSEWSKAIIFPLHKKGPLNDPSNYRGISLLNVMGKIFTKILNNRLSQYVEEMNILSESQGGYRRGYSTIDQAFVLHALVQKYLIKRKGRFYCLYIDFAKAFDCVQHNLLWYVLLKQGINGKILNVIKSMYSKMHSCILTDGGLTDYFLCSLGTRQGCMVSPLLFSLFINEYCNMLHGSNCQGIYVNGNFSNLMTLLFADDMVNCADTVGRLQQQINLLQNFCERYGFKINTDKTKIMVFRKGGPLRKVERWYLNGKQLKVAPHYKYLGITFSTKLSWTRTQQQQVLQANKAVCMIKKFNKKCKYVSTRHLFYLFDQMVVPVLIYGCELWGFKKSETIERVQYKFCKYILNVGQNTPNAAALGDCGRFPLFVTCLLRCIKFWVKLLHMPEHRYQKQVYSMLINLDNSGKSNWVSHVRTLLFESGFGYVWMAQGVGDVNNFLKEFEVRVKDMAIQNWHSDIELCNKLYYYGAFKSMLTLERYVYCIPNKKHRTALAKLRCSNHELAIEIGRHIDISREERICKYCLHHGYNIVEDETHFMQECILYNDLRIKYFRQDLHHPSEQNFIKLFNLDNHDEIKNVAAYVYNSFLRRRRIIDG